MAGVPRVFWGQLKQAALAERHRWPLWLPVALGTGAGAYFAAPAEPSIWAGWGAATLFVTFSGFAVWRSSFWFRALLALLAALSLGFAVAKLREAAIAAPVLERPVIAHLTGRVVALDWGAMACAQ
jgi:competence protein ComEC